MKEKSYKRLLRVFLMLIVVFAVSVMIPSAAKETQAATAGFRTVNGKTYYINKKGSIHRGWLLLNGKLYYFNARTGVQFKGWQYDAKGNKLRYFTTGMGYMRTGFIKDSTGNTRYFDPKTGLLKKGWLVFNGNRYYFQGKEGYMVRGIHVSSSNSIRFFNVKTGAMLTGLQRIGGRYYYFDPKTGILYNRGLKILGSKRYFFNSNGSAQIGWLTFAGRKFYFDSKGVMYVNKTVAIDGKYWKFNSAGVATQVEYIPYGSGLRVYDKKNKKYYTIAREYAAHPNVAGGKLSDRDLLAALVDAEAGDQGLIGMEAVALCLLNRTIKADKEFPSELRYVIYQTLPNSGYPQYTPVRNGALLRRLNGKFEQKMLAYKAVDEAMKIFNNYVKYGKARTLSGFARKDFNYMYFMMHSSFWSQPLNFSRVDYCQYKDHTFFVDWV